MRKPFAIIVRYEQVFIVAKHEEKRSSFNQEDRKNIYRLIKNIHVIKWKKWEQKSSVNQERMQCKRQKMELV